MSASGRTPASGIGTSGSSDRLAPHAAAVFEDHVAAHAVQKSAEFLGIADLLALFGAEKAHQGLLHKIVHIGAVVAHMIEDFVAKLEAEALDGGLGDQGFGGLL